MKPKTAGRTIIGEGMAAGHDDYDDVSLEKAYETVGLLITESRIPDRSAKGRRDGEHISHNLSTHKACSDSSEECEKVRRYREVMGSLCRNGIPLCVEVLLCPRCEIDDGGSAELTANPHHTHEVGSAHSNSYVLLEQWTIQQVHSRADSKLQSLQNLGNAVRSHLCFSQLSAWLQVSQGVTPKHIFYRLTAPGEWFVHKFVMSPGSHRFPDAALGRSRFALRVTLSSLPRTALTPYEISVASRDKLFGVKDASPLLRKSRSSYTNLDTGNEECSDRVELSKSATPNERMHTRSKSVRGIHDLTGRKPPAESPKSRPSSYGAQRCLKYSDDADSLAGAESLSAAEKLASFSTLPTNSINKLELISCATGNSEAKAPPPGRLSISSKRCASLKSPKVLFTRTSMRENFFLVPPLDFESDSELLTPDEDKTSCDDKDEEPMIALQKIHSHNRPERNLNIVLGDESTPIKSSDVSHAPLDDEDNEKLSKTRDSNTSKLVTEHSINGLEHAGEQTRDLKHSSNGEREEGESTNGLADLSHSLNGDKELSCDAIHPKTNSGNEFLEQSHSSNELVDLKHSNNEIVDLKHLSNGIINRQGHSNGVEVDIQPCISGSGDMPSQALPGETSCTNGTSAQATHDDDAVNQRTERGAGVAQDSTRKSRRHYQELNNADSERISATPINKKLQYIKQPRSYPQSNRSRLFRQRPLQSSPAPVKRIGRNSFGYDENITSVEAIKNAISCTSLSEHDGGPLQEGYRSSLTLSSSAPTLTTSNKSSQANLQSRSSLLGNFEESLLNGRIDPAGVVDGFTVDIGASGSFCPKHVSLPVEAYFFNSLSEDDAPSPYLGFVDLSEVSRRGYQIPRKGTLQITLFYPNHKVNKMFVVTYDLSDMPAKSQTFLRQKTVYAPCAQQSENQHQIKGTQLPAKGKLPTYLRYLIHLRFLSTKTNKIFLHTDIRLIYARDKFEFDSRVASYELISYIESPSNPKFSPLR